MLLKMNTTQQHAHPLHVVNLSEGSSPKRLEMNESPQHAHPLQDVNLSEGWARLGGSNAHNFCKM
jgi:hypothetical protein